MLRIRQALTAETAGARARLTAFYVLVLAVTLVVVGGLIYALLARALYSRVDDNLRAFVEIAVTSLGNDLGEGQDVHDAARSTAAELSGRQQMLEIYDRAGTLLAQGGSEADDVAVPSLTSVPSGEVRLLTVAEADDDDDRHRLAMSHVSVNPGGVEYFIVAGSSLEPVDDELDSLRGILAYVVPIALLLTAGGGWFLARESLTPVEQALTQQRQFMADASHELRTPIATSRTAATVALQQPRRNEDEYRETLQIIEQQTTRLSRIVEDMFTLARADSGSYPVRLGPMYLDEVLEEIIKAARVIAATRGILITFRTVNSASFTGDEDLIRRAVVNLLDNAVRHAPAGSTVDVALERDPTGFAISISDAGPGIPTHLQEHVFERFFRADQSRARSAGGGAGLGLALSRWSARAHGGDVQLVRSLPGTTTFRIHLPFTDEAG